MWRHSRLLEETRQSYIVATVIEVVGSASAPLGGKSLFSATGENIYGFVGGGCVERFLAEQSQQCLEEGKVRIVEVDLDDEVFGIGIACGGRMRVLLEPVCPAVQLRWHGPQAISDELTKLAEMLEMGFSCETGDGGHLTIVETRSAGERSEQVTERGAGPPASRAVLTLASAMAAIHGRSGQSLRGNPGAPIRARRLVIIGQSRISEFLCRLADLLGWQAELRSVQELRLKQLQAARFVRLESYRSLNFTADDAVIVASHHPDDPHVLRAALNAGCKYVGMIASRKRVAQVRGDLGPIPENWEQAFFAPVGLDLGWKGACEISLSIVGEILSKGGLSGA